MNPNSCEIRIYDREFNWLGICRTAESVQFARELYGVGRFEIHIQPDKAGAMELLQRGNVIVINGDGHKAGVVRDFYIEGGRSGEQLVVYGETGNGYMRQKLIIPPTTAQVAGSLGWDRVNGDAETVIKHYVGRNMTNPFDTKRKKANMLIAENQNRGKSFPWQARYGVLSDELENIGMYAEMGFETYADLEAGNWIFDVQPGVDRTKSQEINSPVSFNLEYQNVDRYKYTENYSNFRNVGYAGGSGTDENRLIYTLGSENEGDDRFEVFLDCGNAANITELMYYGEQKLNEYNAAKTVEANALPRVFVFEKDYFLGDKVNVFISRLGLEHETRITAVKEIWERKYGYKAEIRFGEKVPNLFTVMRKTEVVH